jgi:hypothetical protein
MGERILVLHSQSKQKWLWLSILVFLIALTAFAFHNWPATTLWIVTGIIAHLFCAETTTLYWRYLGLSLPFAQILAISLGMLTALGGCWASFSIFPQPKNPSRFVRFVTGHPWVRAVPILFIVLFGFVPIVGFSIGIGIAWYTKLPKLYAYASILGTNFFKLVGYARATSTHATFLIRHLAALAHLMHH